MKRLVVSGTTGFVGRHLIEACLEHDIEVLALVRNAERAKLPNHDLVKIHEWSLGSPRSLIEVLHPRDTFVHLAAHIPKDHRSPDEARVCLEVNTLGPLEVLEDCRHAGVKHVVITSTNLYPITATNPDEEAPLAPSPHSPHYMLSKLGGDVLSLQYSSLHDISVTILRLGNVFASDMPSSQIVIQFARSLLAGKAIELQNGGSYQMDLVPVSDVVDAILLACSRSRGGAYNIGSGQGISCLELAEVFRSELNSDSDLVRVLQARQSAKTGFPIMNIERAKTELGYTPTPTDIALRQLLAELGQEHVRRRHA